MARTVAIVIGAVVVLSAAALFLVWPALLRSSTYPGGRLAPGQGDPALWGLPDGEEVRLTAADGVRLPGWWIPARTADACGAVVYFHGNANTIAPRAWLGRALAERGLDVLLFDYRGYGLSEGRPSEAG
ncbi:MAG: alpha/beta hydrolase, partial [Gemmatimonadota bacterium]